jgi:hypothetical protein
MVKPCRPQVQKDFTAKFNSVHISQIEKCTRKCRGATINVARILHSGANFNRCTFYANYTVFSFVYPARIVQESLLVLHRTGKWRVYNNHFTFDMHDKTTLFVHDGACTCPFVRAHSQTIYGRATPQRIDADVIYRARQKIPYFLMSYRGAAKGKNSKPHRLTSTVTH